jgi:cell division protein FtsL
MYQSPAALDYTAAYQQDEAMRHAADRRLASQVDRHTSAEHQLIAAVIAVLLVLTVIVLI